MGDEAPKVMGWGAIVAITAATAVALGLVLGALGEVVGRSSGTAGVGAGTGVVAALLIGRRRAARQASAGGRTAPDRPAGPPS